MSTSSSRILFPAGAAAALILGLAITAHSMQKPLPPSDLPRNAQLVVTGYEIRSNEQKGEWVACEVDQENGADFCRIADIHGTVLFQGEFLPITSPRPVAAEQLKLAAIDSNHLWMHHRNAAPMPVIPLLNGQSLVPSAEREAIAEKLQQDPNPLTNDTSPVTASQW